MKKVSLDNKYPIFEFYPATTDMIGVLSIPHSGEILPTEFKKYLINDMPSLMQDVDFRVHELIDIDQLNSAGIGVVKANIIRTAIDLNRSKDRSLLNWKKNSKGVQIVDNEPASEISTRLVEQFYSPYFEFLKTLLNQLSLKTNTPSFIDLHSMPSVATAYHLKINPNQSSKRPDFCISDKVGKTCSQEFIDTPTKLLANHYPNVTNNDPYFGGHITVHIDEAFPSANNIQIEISRDIYMNEQTQELITQKVERLKPILTSVLIESFKKHFSPL